jgi:soluble lytic murein transglycosylase
MLWIALALALPTATGGPPFLLPLHGSERPTLAAVEGLLAESPEGAAELGLHYLRGHLLEEAGRHEEAARAFALSLAHAPELRPYARLRLARLESRFGHPEVAAGLVASLLRSDPPRELLAPAVRLLHDSLERGGDCRLLQWLHPQAMPPSERRHLDLSRAHCAAREGRTEAARDLFAQVMRAGISDEAARRAAQRLLLLPWDRGDRSLAAELGAVLHRHRLLDQALTCLEPAARALPARLGSREDFETLSILARSHLAKGQADEAAARFADLSRRLPRGPDQAMALLEQGQALELAGHGTRARTSYIRAANIAPPSPATAPALLAALRLQWLQGDREESHRTLEVLQARPPWSGHASQGALFIASSELSKGRASGVSTLLHLAAQGTGGHTVETYYWLGRLEEARGRPSSAVDYYIRLLRLDPHHPLGREARGRLRRPELSRAAAAAAAERAQSPRLDERLAAWWLLAEQQAGGRETIALRAYQQLVRDPALRPFLALAPVEPAEWPLWSAPRDSGEEMLLALGLWQDVGMPTLLAHFSPREPRLALTASRRLSAGGAPAKGLQIARMIERRIDGRVPHQLLPLPYRQALHPVSFAAQVVDHARRHRAEPALLLAVLRELSGFDADAVSPQGARGLAQLTTPVAASLARGMGREPPTPEELLGPMLSIELAAAHLGQLQRRLGQDHLVLAAYVAGIDQALLWRSYCYSDDVAEYLTKIALPDSRALIERLLESADHYRDLYPELSGSRPRIPG